MSTNLNYKQVTNVERRTWDVETYEKKAKDRQAAADDGEPGARKVKKSFIKGGDAAAAAAGAAEGRDEEAKEEFAPAAKGAAGPEGSQRAFLKARRDKVDVESKVGQTEIISAEAAATTKTDAGDDGGGVGGGDNGVVKTGVGWHCRVCDCFLKDSHTYLDHINGRKHQRKLGFSMRVERSTKDQLLDRLNQLTKKKEEEEGKGDNLEDDPVNYEDAVAAKDEEARRRKEERRRRRQERKKMKQESVEEVEEEDVEAQVDPAMAEMMGFSGFGGM